MDIILAKSPNCHSKENRHTRCLCKEPRGVFISFKIEWSMNWFMNQVTYSIIELVLNSLINSFMLRHSYSVVVASHWGLPWSGRDDGKPNYGQEKNVEPRAADRNRLPLRGQATARIYYLMVPATQLTLFRKPASNKMFVFVTQACRSRFENHNGLGHPKWQ